MAKKPRGPKSKKTVEALTEQILNMAARDPVLMIFEDAHWVEISWDEALDRTAEGLARAIRTGGPDALGIYLGNPNVHSLGAQTHGTRMVKALRTRNRFSASSVDQVPMCDRERRRVPVAHSRSGQPTGRR